MTCELLKLYSLYSLLTTGSMSEENQMEGYMNMIPGFKSMEHW